MNIYADSSFFVSLYVTDGHSSAAQSLLRKAGSQEVRLWLTPLHVAEWSHAVERHVHRKAMTRRDADLLHAAFEQHRDSGVWLQTPVPDMAMEECSQIARRHVAALGVRTLDSLHVACALQLGARRFWTFDERQKLLARAVGLRTT